MAKIVLAVVLTAVAIISTSAYRAFLKSLDKEAEMWMSENRSIAYQLNGYISRRLYDMCGLVRDTTIAVILMSFFLDLGLILAIPVAAFAAGIGLYACSTVWNVEIDPYA